jgi:hypothetical protein
MKEVKGVGSRRTRSGIQILRVHYTADPERDSAWARSERQKYSSQAAWDREQEIIHEAGGGELVFAEILNRYADKIIIRNPNFQVPPFWKRIGGFDHGKTNPTAALVATVDCRVPHSFALFANEWEESSSLDPVVPVTSELSSVSLLCPRDPGTVSLLWRRRLTLHHLQLGGWPGLSVFSSTLIETVGAPLLRFLQGRERDCRQHKLFAPHSRHAIPKGNATPTFIHPNKPDFTQ